MPCRSELAREKLNDAAFIQEARVIVEGFREQARSTNQEYRPDGKPGIPQHRRTQQQFPQAIQAVDAIGPHHWRRDFRSGQADFSTSCAALMSQLSSSWSITRLTPTKLPTKAKLAASRRTGNQSNAWRNCVARSAWGSGCVHWPAPTGGTPGRPPGPAGNTRKSPQKALVRLPQQVALDALQQLLATVGAKLEVAFGHMLGRLQVTAPPGITKRSQPCQ